MMEERCGQMRLPASEPALTGGMPLPCGASIRRGVRAAARATRAQCVRPWLKWLVPPRRWQRPRFERALLPPTTSPPPTPHPTVAPVLAAHAGGSRSTPRIALATAPHPHLCSPLCSRRASRADTGTDRDGSYKTQSKPSPSPPGKGRSSPSPPAPPATPLPDPVAASMKLESRTDHRYRCGCGGGGGGIRRFGAEGLREPSQKEAFSSEIRGSATSNGVKMALKWRKNSAKIALKWR